MKILHAIDHLDIGGAQTLLLNLLVNWPRQDDEMHVIGVGPKNMLHPSFAALNIHLHRSAPPHFPWNLFALRKLITSGDYDVVHCHLTKSMTIGLLTKIPISTRLILHEHGNPCLRPWPYYAAMRYGWKNAAAVVAVSAVSKAALEKMNHLGKGVVRVIPNGIPLDMYRDTPDVQALRDVWNIPPDALPIGFVGRLSKVKGPGYFIDAIADLYRSHKKILGIVVGDGPLRSDLEAKAAALKISHIVKFVGFQKDVRRWSSLFKVGVVPSLSEGFGLSAIEFMAAGVPVVASDVGGLREIILHEKTGLLVQPHDVLALESSISRLLSDEDLSKSLTEAGRARVADHFSIENTRNQLAALYDELCQNGSDNAAETNPDPEE